MATRYHDNVPDPAKRAALEQAKKTGSLSPEGKKRLTAEIEAYQAKLPTKPQPNQIEPTAAEVEFTADFDRLLGIADDAAAHYDATGNALAFDLEQLAISAYKCFRFQQAQIDRLKA